MLDGVGGAALVGCLGLGLVWIGGAVALHTPGRQRAARADPALGDPAASSTSACRRRGRSCRRSPASTRSPRSTGPTPDVPPPDSRDRPRPGRAARPGRSVVKVLGTACGLGVQGSGWVAGDGIVVTNAHVVAGQDDTTVQVRRRGPRLGRRGDLVRPAQRPGDAARPGRRGRAGAAARHRTPTRAPRRAILGFPENGPYDVRPARLGQTSTVVSQDAYGRGPVRRRSPRCAASCARATRAARWWTARAAWSPRSSRRRSRTAAGAASACPTRSCAMRSGGRAARSTPAPARASVRSSAAEFVRAPALRRRPEPLQLLRCVPRR